MLSVKIVTKTKKLNDGTFPIYLRITKDRRSKFFKTLYNVKPNQWDSKEGRFSKNNENYIQGNRLLIKMQDRAMKILTDLEIEKGDFTLEDFEQAFRVNSNSVRSNIFLFWNEIIEEQIGAGRTGNARFHKETSNSVKRFNRSSHLNFRQITPTFLAKYEAFLRAGGSTDGGIATRMRSIRSIYNTAIERSVVKEQFYPFKVYKISKLKGRSIKKALNFEQIQRIIEVDLSEYPTLQDSRNFFVFSFYTRGMNFTDMMYLEWDDIVDDRIYYTRAKTKGQFSLNILPPVKELLDYYKAQNRATKYVFPILLHDNLTPVQIEDRKKKVIVRYNQRLKEIGKICKIEKPLSTYVARHSFANCLKQKGVATDIISESLGHQNLAITQAYLKDLDSSVLDKASELLL